jgi:hypothetical protein
MMRTFVRLLYDKTFPPVAWYPVQLNRFCGIYLGNFSYSVVFCRARACAVFRGAMIATRAMKKCCNPFTCAVARGVACRQKKCYHNTSELTSRFFVAEKNTPQADSTIQGFYVGIFKNNDSKRAGTQAVFGRSTISQL